MTWCETDAGVVNDHHADPIGQMVRSGDATPGGVP
jgi:hypothetical protein